jgi:UDP-glucose 4-epimerase
MKVLVTGGLGNLGSWITESLILNGDQVTTFSKGDRDVLKQYTFERIFGEIDNEADVAKLFSNNSWDVIIHLASVNEGNAPNYFNTAIKVNTIGTRNLLNALSLVNNTTHFIYFSTFHVYGLNSGLINENISPEPKNDYASTHLFAEYYVKQYHYSKRIPYTTIRLTNSYGAPKETSSSKWYLILNDLAKMAYEKGVIKLNSNGKPARDFVWMGDVCNAVKQCMLKGPANDTYNLGGGKTMTMLDVAQVIKQAYQDYFSKPIDIKVNAADVNEYDSTLQVSIEKLKSWIDFESNDKLYLEATEVFNLLKQSTVRQ